MFINNQMQFLGILSYQPMGATADESHSPWGLSPVVVRQGFVFMPTRSKKYSLRKKTTCGLVQVSLSPNFPLYGPTIFGRTYA